MSVSRISLLEFKIKGNKMMNSITYWEEIKRKLVHLSSLWMVVVTLLISLRWVRCLLFGILLVVTLIAEHDYANNGRYLGKLYGKFFGKMLRNEVHHGQWIVSGGIPVLAAAFFVNLFFSPLIAAISLTILLTGDAAAALVGRKIGHHRTVNGKSLEGSAAFIVAAYAASAVVLLCSNAASFYYLLLFPTVLIGAAVELFQKQLLLDDNLLIPIFCALFFQCIVL